MVLGSGKIDLKRARVWKLSAGLGQGMLELGKVRSK